MSSELVAVYMRRAEEAERLARTITFEPDRQAMLDIARQWRELAADAEKRIPEREA